MVAVSTPSSPASLLQISCFVHVAEAGSFAAAGRRLGLTTSGVCKAVGRLEAEHRVRLFHRSTHALSLTGEGEKLLDGCRSLVESYERVRSDLSEAGDGDRAGRVRIGAPPGFTRKWLLPVLGRMLEEHPEIELDIRSAYAIVDLADEGFDLALRTGAAAGLQGLSSRPLLSSAWCVYAAPAYLERHGVPADPSELATHRLLGFRADPRGRAAPWRFRNPGKAPPDQLSLDVAAPIVFDDGCAAYDMALAGNGLVWAPEWLASEDLSAGRMVEVLADWRAEEQTVSVVRRHRRLPTGRVRVVMDALKEAAAIWEVRRT